MTSNAMPGNWVRTTIDQIARTSTGGTPSRKNGTYFGGHIPWVKSGELRDSIIYETEETLTKSGLDSSAARLFPKGTLCIALYGATVGKLGTLGIDAATNQAICGIFVGPGIDTRYLYRLLESRRRDLLGQAKGGAQSNISNAIIRQTEVPLPPTGEQCRIVEAIEQQFTRLDAGVAALKRVEANLRRYKAAVLKAACEGRLTEKWRQEHPDVEPASELLKRILKDRRRRWEEAELARMIAKGKPPKDERWKERYEETGDPPESTYTELPTTWRWATVGQVGEVKLGRQRSPEHHTGPHMRPYLRVANVFEDRIDTTDVLSMNFTPREFEVYRLDTSDILLNEGQSLQLVGRPAMYRNEVPGACFQNTLVRFRGGPGLDRRFALIVFLAYLHSGRFQRIAKWTVNIAHLGADRFSHIEFPLPPQVEQEEIAGEVDRRLSVVAQLQAALVMTKARSSRLRQSILKRAFEGKLVPQDPNDEPASVLLERIRTERASTPAPRVSSKSRTSTKRRSQRAPVE